MYHSMLRLFWMEMDAGQRQKECRVITDMHREARMWRQICEEAWSMGIKYLTVYAFSTENWNRPKEEVDALMKLLRNYMKTCLKTAAKNDMKVRVIGDITPLDEDIQKTDSGTGRGKQRIMAD